MTEFFTGMDIRDMNFEERDVNCQKGVTYCNRCMGKGRWVNEYEVILAHGTMNAVY